MRVPGDACSWAWRRASSRAVIRSVSVEASRAVSTMVRSAPADRASGREGAKETDGLGRLPGAPVASWVSGPTVWIETSFPSVRTRGVSSGTAVVEPAQESAGLRALARVPRPRVSQPSAEQVRSAGVRTDRFIGSLAEAKDSRWAADESTRSESAWSPAR